jgi:FtsZ-interacting cell division protein ZipA
MPNAALLIGAIVVVAILIVASWSLARRQRSEGLQRTAGLRERFGSEYDRTLVEMGDTRSAEKELTARQKRVESFEIKPLVTEEGQRFSAEWQVMQASFVDDPSTAVHDADLLIGRVMSARGYPESDYEQRSADVSVDHPEVLSSYRAAHEIALRDAEGKANTEDLRQAVISSHVLFTELVEEPSAVEPSAVEPPAVEPPAVEPNTQANADAEANAEAKVPVGAK